MAKPVLMVVDDDGPSLDAICGLLGTRYGGDYEVISQRSSRPALAVLDKLSDGGVPVAVVIAACRAPDAFDPSLFTGVRVLHPRAKRVLAVPFGPNWADLILQAMTLGSIDDYVLTPWGHPEEHLYPRIGELLCAWVKSTDRPTVEAVRVVGQQWAPASAALRDFLERNNLWYGFYADDSDEGRRILDEAHQDGHRLPVAVLWNGVVLVEPTYADLAAQMGVRTRPDEGIHDLAIVGGGPAGLAAGVYGASEGLDTLIIEREAPGGQAGTSSMIRNYLGFPRGIGGLELAQKATEQAWLFGAALIGNAVTGLRPAGSHHVLTFADGGETCSRAVVLATGISYRRLGLPGLDRLSGAGVFYGAGVAEARSVGGLEVFIVGAGNSAGQAALHFAKHAAHVTIVMRGRSLTASMSDYLIKEIAGTANIVVRPRTEVTALDGGSRLEGLTLRNPDGSVHVRADALFIMIGAKPLTDWLPGGMERDNHGFVVTGRDLLRTGRTPAPWPLDRPPFESETSIPGVFAVGDLRSGSVKRVAAAVGAGSAVVQYVHEYLRTTVTA
ncbi:MAG TPA: FAD-dependent oxidoreductase [Actinoplanes sp.]